MSFGTLSIEHFIKGRRVIYYHSLVNRDKSQMIYSFLLTQYLYRTKGDWITQVLKDFEDLKINSDFIFLENISALKFKSLVKEKLNWFAFNQFMSMKKLHSKMKNLSYNRLKIKDYLLDENTRVKEKKVAFKWRTFMKDISDNFRGENKLVPVLYARVILTLSHRVFSVRQFLN